MVYPKKETHQDEKDEPVTPAGRMFLQPLMDQVINTAIGVKQPIDIPAFKAAIQDSLLIKHPRFRSLYVKPKHGREHWRTLHQVDLDKHILEKHLAQDSDNDEEDAINSYIADLSVSTPLPTDKPLWEIHVLKAQRCFILRIHHSLGDGVSLMSLFLTCCRRAGHPDELPNIPSGQAISKRKGSVFEKVWRLVMVVLLTLVYVLKFIARVLWVKDEKSEISGGNGVELWPRKLATAKFSLEDMKLVKQAVHNATINDVLFGVISSGLTRYLEQRSTKKTKEGHQFTGLAMVNIRKQTGLQDLSKMMENNNTSSRWGNQFGFIQLPLYHHKDVDDPLKCVTRAKAMLDRKKLSLEAYFSYVIGKLVMSLLGPKVAARLTYTVICHTTFTVSNIVGPQEEIMFAETPMTYIRVNSTSLAHAITMHMVSYNGIANMQILTPKEIIPDPRVLAKCFQDVLLEMKDAAIATKIKEGKTLSNGGKR